MQCSWGLTLLEHVAIPKSLSNCLRFLHVICKQDGAFLIRLEHIFGVDDFPGQLSASTSVDLKAFIESLDLVRSSRLRWIRETALGGNVWKDDVSRMEFKAETNDVIRHWYRGPVPRAGHQLNPRRVEFQPMEIRTFQFGMDTK